MSPGGAPLRRPSEDFAPARALLDYVRSAPSGVGDTVVDEDQVRAELARLLAALDGMVARLPGEENWFLTHPHGLFFHEIKASDLMLILDGIDLRRAKRRRDWDP